MKGKINRVNYHLRIVIIIFKQFKRVVVLSSKGLNNYYIIYNMDSKLKTPLIKIPRNIFQTWKTKNFSHNLKNLTDTWINHNPNYAYFLFDDNDCELFIKKHFEKKVYDAYRRIIPGAFKCDLWRYCVLYIYGGVYVDIDTICLNPIDMVLNEDIEFMTPIDLNNGYYTGKHNLFNTFIASIPKHPILLECIHRVVHNIENGIIPVSKLDVSGPGVLGRASNIFLNHDEISSFVGKEGIYNNTILFLHFQEGIEYISNYTNKSTDCVILFQNKNGNLNIKNVYNEELKTINYIDWGKCQNPIRPLYEVSNDDDNLPTIVTMIYNIREKEVNMYDCELNHNIEKYLDNAKKFILQLPYPLIIFTDDNQIIEILKQERKDSKKTYIYNKKFEETYFYKDLDNLVELQKKFHIVNGVIEHETPMYIILNNNKFDCIDKTIEMNPFNSSHLIWMDFGINHVAQNTERIHDWINKVPDKIKQLCINPFTENTPFKQHFEFIYHNMAGGLFSGSLENMRKYSELFKNKTEDIYNDNWYQIDEAVMTMVQRENPDLFDLYYGDYIGIISNYLSPIHDIDLILTGSQKCINSNRINEAFNILIYCLKYFIDNPNDHYTFIFIEQNIIVNYYVNNRLLLDEVIELINLKKKSNNEQDNIMIHNLLETNKLNINYYDNKELIYN